MNLVLDMEKDYSGPNSDIHARKREVVVNYMQIKGYQDVWRNMNPDKYIYTWKRNGPPLNTSRLDYFLVSEGLVSKVKSTNIAPSYRSDHNQIEMVMNLAKNVRGRGYWKFNSQYLRDKEFIQEMNSKIDSFIKERADSDRTPDAIWEALKVEMKMVASEYAIKKANAKSKLIELLEYKMNKLQTKLMTYQQRKDTAQIDKILKDLKRTQEFLEDEHESKTKAAMFRSKSKFYNEGEKNSKYFFQLEKTKYNQKNRNQLIAPDTGLLVKDPQQILKEEALFFKRLYKKGNAKGILGNNDSQVKINENDKKELDREMSISELSKALSGMENDKTPGEDGLTASFFKVFWIKIKEVYFQAIKFCLQKGQLYSSARRGILSLIPKKEKNLLYTKNWRPITLLNVDFKILTKALAIRLKDKLPFLINEDQTGYMQNRNISHNLRTILDVVQIAKDRDINMVILSVDYEKCYDRISHKAILDALRFFNFGEVFNGYVETCLKDSTLSIQNNGNFSESLEVQRGIKQGDCLSPFLALIVMEIFSIRIRDNSKIKGLQINGQHFKLVQFADDLNMFLKFEKETLLEVIRALDRFHEETDFKVNYDKTSIHRIGSLADSDTQIYTGKPF